MSTNSIFLVLICLFLTRTQSQRPFRQYVIEKDLFSGFKAGEFSIYDQSGKILLYRLESQFSFTQKAKLYAFPSKQMVASIRNVGSSLSKISTRRFCQNNYFFD